MSYSEELSLAIELVKRASKITEWFRTKHSSSFTKEDDSPVTLADFASQIFIISMIKKSFPGDQIIAEEESGVLLNSSAENAIRKCFNALQIKIGENLKDTLNYRGDSSNRQWTVDPVDGTKGFQRNLAYAIGIGFMVRSEPTLCAISVPNYSNTKLSIFSAKKNHGAKASYGDQGFTNINVSETSDLSTSRMSYSLHYNKPWVLDLAKSLGITNFIPMDSMAKLCMVAEGSAEIYVKPMNIQRSFTWDFLPGELLVREAGGMVTDLQGKSVNYVDEKCVVSAPGLIASNGINHNEIIEALKSIEILRND
ncbi:MAG: inositol monophosphatase family protein [Candidatus Hermodarchaeota archaeon]